MPAPRETPLTRTRGKMNHVRGKAYKNSQPVSLIGHYLRAAICDRDTYERLVEVSSGNGITQDEQGVFEASFPASDMSSDTLPETRYWYEVEIWENEDEERRYVLQHGDLYLRPSPFE